MSSYTSNLLCHFVGRSKSTDDERFDLLIKIIKGNKLIANISNPNNLESSFRGGYRCENVGEVFSKCDCVCFCDIPNESLDIHTSKYSKFGMGFEKKFIAEQGARPVMYVPKNCDIVERGDSDKSKSSTPRNPNEYFPSVLQTTTNLLPLVIFSNLFINLQQVERAIVTSEIGNHIYLFDSNIRNNYFSGKSHPMLYNIIQGVATQMAYVKLYDATLPDDHPDNYYMEREWRSLKNIAFSISDIMAIYVPTEEYKERFFFELPEYKGEIFVLNKKSGENDA